MHRQPRQPSPVAPAPSPTPPPPTNAVNTLTSTHPRSSKRETPSHANAHLLLVLL